ncbi:hypothetical protein OJ998_06280 [Solirubrobacter taibaiensis]|nr:hypothetical protein [Solirubrobacter taibaiensis]
MITGNGKLRTLRARVAMGTVAAVSALAIGTTAADAATVRLAGTDVVGTHVSSAANGSAEVYRTSATATGSVSSISVNLDGTSDASALEVGLYSDEAGQPTTLLTSARTNTPAAGWNTVAVPSAQVESGKAYWVAVLNPSDATGTLRWTDRAGAGDPGEQTGGSTTLSTLPDTWLTGGVYSDGPLSAYVTGEEAAPAGPTLSVTPSALSFWSTRGQGNPAPKTVDVANAGSGSLAYAATENGSWLSITGASGNAPGAIKASINTSGLAAGTYTAQITITAPGAADAPRTVPVTLTVNPQPATSGLVGAWGFDETSGDTVLDSSGRRNSGALQGATRTANGIYGRAVNFDGQDDWITVADNSSLDLTTGATLEAWVKPAAIDNAWRTILIKEQSDQLAYALYANTDASRPSGNVFTTQDNGLAGPNPLPADRWSHVATTFDGTTLRLYVNGVEVSSMPVTGPIKVSSGALRMGGNAVWGEWFNGTLDEVRVYNRALSGAELMADRDTPIANGTGSEVSPLEKLKALLLKLLAKWKKHWGEWVWHGHRGYFHGGN